MPARLLTACRTALPRTVASGTIVRLPSPHRQGDCRDTAQHTRQTHDTTVECVRHQQFSCRNSLELEKRTDACATGTKERSPIIHVINGDPIVSSERMKTKSSRASRGRHDQTQTWVSPSFVARLLPQTDRHDNKFLRNATNPGTSIPAKRTLAKQGSGTGRSVGDVNVGKRTVSHVNPRNAPKQTSGTETPSHKPTCTSKEANGIPITRLARQLTINSRMNQVRGRSFTVIAQHSR